jgi:3-hydroxyacyl-CoA dehydrogenase
LLLLEGASPQQIDEAMESWGMAMGPLRVFDLAGLDIGYTARKALCDEQKGDPKTYRVPDLLVEAGRLGQKSGSGFYAYDENRKPRPDAIVDDIIRSAAADLGVERREISDDEIVDRLISALVDEGRKILDEGIAQRSSDIDVVYVYGYGFPASRGGPMYYADHL